MEEQKEWLKGILEGNLTEIQKSKIFSIIDQNQDGIIQAQELHQTFSDDIKRNIIYTVTAFIDTIYSGLETLIVDLIDTVEVDLNNLSFPDFLIFVSKRKKGNGALRLFEEYDEGKISSLC